MVEPLLWPNVPIVNVKSQGPRQTSMTGLPRVLGHGDSLVRVRVAKYDIGDP